MGGSVLLVEESGVPGENLRHATSHWQTLSHYVVSSIWGLNDYLLLITITFYQFESAMKKTDRQ